MRIVSRLPSATELLCVIGCDDLPAVFRGTHLDPSRFVFHCFTGTPDEARRRLDFGAWTSFTRAVTFKKSKPIAEAARLVSENRIMVETDAPDMNPEPEWKILPNEPKHIAHVARFPAQIRDMDPTAFS
ncbi:MAG: TatD family hydrolase [Planctomycetes bacterium]|nr:TatD family hydrolase [Planctomycetota bacterium]